MGPLRKDHQKTYADAIKNTYATLTAAPFFSLKTEIIKTAIADFPEAALFDLRKGIDQIVNSSVKHVFIDAIEVIALNKLKEIIFDLKRNEKVVHLVSHLYYYEEVLPFLSRPRLIFPQLLSKSDLKQAELLLEGIEGKARILLSRFIEYGDGWPGILKLMYTKEKLESLKKSISVYEANSNTISEQKYFKALVQAYASHYFDLLKKTHATCEDFLRKSFKVPEEAYCEYHQEKITLKELVERVNPNLWHFVRFGFLWLDEEQRDLRVPAPIADYFIG